MTIDIDDYFAHSLKSARKQKKISQVELAKQSGLNRTYISMLERGTRKPSTEALINLANALDFSACEFIKDIEKEVKKP